MRNYEKEAAWSKRKYIRLLADIDREVGERFKEKLVSDGVKYADWLREKIKEYLGEA